jgi:hypothetical protein
MHVASLSMSIIQMLRASGSPLHAEHGLWSPGAAQRRSGDLVSERDRHVELVKLVFNETGKSILNIAGVTFSSAGLGLSNLNSGVDFIDNASTNKVLTSLTAASSTLRSEASSLSIVQIRQEEPDQRAADRLVQPDAGRHQRGSGEQSGAVHPPVDRGVRAGAGQLLAAERASAAPLSPTARHQIEAAGETPPFSLY